MKVCSCSPQRHNNSILSFLAPPYRHRARPRPCWITTLGRALQGDSLAPFPITDIIPLPRPSASGFVPPGLVKRVCDQRRNKWRRTGWLLARAGYVSSCCKVVFMVYIYFMERQSMCLQVPSCSIFHLQDRQGSLNNLSVHAWSPYLLHTLSQQCCLGFALGCAINF